MIEVVNDFFTVVCGTDFTTRTTNVDVDIDGYNEIIIRNETTTIVSIPANAVALYRYDTIRIKGKENQVCKGKLTIKFLNNLVTPGRCVFIRKKYKNAKL